MCVDIFIHTYIYICIHTRTFTHTLLFGGAVHLFCQQVEWHYKCVCVHVINIFDRPIYTHVHIYMHSHAHIHTHTSFFFSEARSTCFANRQNVNINVSVFMSSIYLIYPYICLSRPGREAFQTVCYVCVCVCA